MGEIVINQLPITEINRCLNSFHITIFNSSLSMREKDSRWLLLLLHNIIKQSLIILRREPYSYYIVGRMIQ